MNQIHWIILLPFFSLLATAQATGCETPVTENSVAGSEMSEFVLGGMGRDNLLSIPTEFDSADDFEPWTLWGRAEPLIASGRQNLVDFLRIRSSGAVAIRKSREFVGVIILEMDPDNKSIEITGVGYKGRIHSSQVAQVIAECPKSVALHKFLTFVPNKVKIVVPEVEIEAWRALIQAGYAVHSLGQNYELTWQRKDPTH